MDENQINHLLKNVPNYQGSFAVDELNETKVLFYPSFLVINLDTRGNNGTHWIAVAIYQSQIFICDSLGGILPDKTFPRQLIDFLYPLATTRKLHITKQLQPFSSNLCGLYCITFIKEMSEHNCFCEFLRLFSTDYVQNDTVVKFLNKGDFYYSWYLIGAKGSRQFIYKEAPNAIKSHLSNGV